MSKSNLATASIQKRISASAIASAAGPIQTRGIGTTQITSPAISGRRISVVVIQPWRVI